jgi:hypothetical protein
MAIPIAPARYTIAEDEPAPAKQPARLAGKDDDDEANEPAGRPRSEAEIRRENRRQIRMVQLGLGFHYWKYLTFVLGLNLAISGAILFSITPTGGVMMIGLGDFAVLVSLILGLVGSIMCTAVPPKTGARVFILVSLGLDSTYLFFLLLSYCISFVAQILPGQNVGHNVVLILALGFWLGGYVLFMLFLRQFAIYLDDHRAADEAMMHMYAMVVVLAGGVMVMSITAAILLRFATLWIALVALGAEYICFLVLFIKILFGVLEVIGLIRTRIN